VPGGPLRVAIFVFDGVDELDAVGPYEVFANGERAARRSKSGS